MLNIIKSGFTSGGHERIKKEILRDVQDGKKALLIVPEQQTLLAEAELADLLPDNAPLLFEVTNFTRLANTAARALGGIGAEYCDKTKKALIMWRTLTELSPILTFGSRDINEGLVNRYLAASANLDSLGISSDMLSAALESEFVCDTRLKLKLSDLLSVHSLYKSLIAEKYGDSENECAKMLEKLRQNPAYLSDTGIYIEGFISFTETQYAILRELAGRCRVSLLINISHSSGDAFEYTEVRNTLERVKKEARLSGSEIKIYTEDSRNSDDVISLAADLLWRTRADFDNISLQKREKMRIFEAETPFEECEFVASDIKRRVMAGAHFSDFAIVVRSAEKYKGILDTALSLASVPAFFSIPEDISSFEVIKHIYSAYAAIRSGYSRDNVISYAKCSLGGITRDECDRLEYYAEKWQISGGRFADGEMWNMNPDGYSAAWREGAAEELIEINAIKDRLINPLLSFEAALASAKTVREQAAALYNHLVSAGVPEALTERADRLISLGEGAFAEDGARLWQTVCTALDTLVALSGDAPADADAFLGQLKIAFGNVDISKIPAYADEVTVGSADMLRLYGKKHIYLIGVNMGEFPANASDNAYFTEADKSALSKAGLALTPDLELRSARELYLFARAFTYGSESVTLGYSLRDTKYKPRERSDVIDKLLKIFGGELDVTKISSLSAEKRLFSADPSLVSLSSLSENEAAAAEAALARAGKERLVKISHESITNEALSFDGTLAAKDNDKKISLTQSRIDSYKNCPLGYFCRYTLSLMPEERAEFDARNIGTFIHAILENVFRELYEKNTDTATLTESERIEITTRAAEKYVASLGEGSLDSERTKIKINRLVRASLPVVGGLCDEFCESKFKPKFFELAITGGKEDSPEPVKTLTEGGREVLVYGYIDRVDTYLRDGNVYVRVVDYKTGAKSFSPTDPAEGKNLQMFLYLKSILDEDKKAFSEKLGVKDGGRVIPAGVIYVKTSVSDTRVDRPDDALAEAAVKSAQKREGMVLDDEDVISAMGLKYTPLYSARTPDKIPESKKEFLFTEEKLAGLMNDALSVVGEVADEIAEGNIKATPRVHDGGRTYCDSCEFKPICRKAVVL